jgi:S1-C subfamily serine protease
MGKNRLKTAIFLIGISVICAATLNIFSISSHTDRSSQNLANKTVTHRIQPEKLTEKAKTIVVKVISSEGFIGSGVLVGKQDRIYTITTNAHVLRSGSLPYRVQTHDGRVYPAQLNQSSNFGGNDLALLTFNSPNYHYPVVAPIIRSTEIGDEVFVAGFPESEEEDKQQKFTLTSGKIKLILPKILDDGYQIGYTNKITNGMSGGALLNDRGDLIGINGKRAYPAWNIPSNFGDGSKVTADIHQQIIQLSWAIPMEILIPELSTRKDSSIDRQSLIQK